MNDPANVSDVCCYLCCSRCGLAVVRVDREKTANEGIYVNSRVPLITGIPYGKSPCGEELTRKEDGPPAPGIICSK